jgi:hypothetical protein
VLSIIVTVLAVIVAVAFHCATEYSEPSIINLALVITGAALELKLNVTFESFIEEPAVVKLPLNRKFEDH